MAEIQVCSKADILRYITVVRLNFENAYPTRNDDEMALLIESWYSILKNYPREVCNEAVMQTLKRARFAPRIGDVVETIEKMQNVFQKSDSELWNELVKVTPQVWSLLQGYQDLDNKVTIKSLFDGLSPELKAYLHSSSGLRQIANYDYEQMSYERGRFMRIMPQVKEKEKTRRELPANVAVLVKGLEDKIQIADKKLLGEAVEENT